MTLDPSRAVVTAAKVLLVLGFVGLAARVGHDRLTGLRLTIETPPGQAGPQALERRASEASSDALLLDPEIPAGVPNARFEGLWWVKTGGLHVLTLKGRAAAEVWLDGSLVFREKGGPRPREQIRVDLARGLHALRADFPAPGRLPVFKLTLTTEAGEPPRGVFPDRPAGWTQGILPILTVLRGAFLPTLALALLSLVYALRLGAPTRRALFAALLMLYAGSLRLESVVRQCWGLEAPTWARWVTAVVTEIRPNALKLPPEEHPYAGDPGGYLRYARAMERFYDAHVREPLFVAATKAGLALSSGADIGISLTSAAFSTLMVLALYFLGVACFGQAVGLLAAFLLAIEPQVIGLAAGGWRDEAFSLFVLLTTLALVRLRAKPSFVNALFTGVAGGACCLTRITSLSFFIPALVFLCFGGDPSELRPRRGAVALALVIALALVLPYLASCAIAFGDPFLAINTHTGFYRDRAGLPSATSMNWAQYLATTFKPVELARNLAEGLTRYPFTNKWFPYSLWLPGLAPVLRLLSLAGLVLFVTDLRGRLLLVVLFAALLPFAFTWGVSGGSEWRLTLVAYPFYLLAASLAASRALGLSAQLHRALGDAVH